jgi:hypothetical protein
MKSSAIVAVAVALALSGCGPRRAGRQESNPSTVASATGNLDRAVTIAGCLVPDDATKQNEVARNSTTPPPPGFRVVDVAVPARDAAMPSGATGTTGTAQSYTLDAEKDRLNDLQRFANSRVEVSGTIVASAQPGDAPRLRVQDVRQLESKCGAAKQP